MLHAPPTTAPSIAVHNLNASIADRERKSRAGDLAAEKELVGYYAMRARFLGRISDLAAAEKTSAHLVAALPNDAATHFERALSRSTSCEGTRRSSTSSASGARAHGGRESTSERAALLLALGREDEAASLAGRPRPGADVGELVMAASIAAKTGSSGGASPDSPGRRGSEELSDKLFDAARAGYLDVSPFTVAWVDFERARALESRGDRLSARAYLAEAAQILPCYAHAVVHLAALEPPADALRRLGPLDGASAAPPACGLHAGEASDDPDVLAAQADALRREGKSAEATAMASRARARFEEVIAALPKAYADHAASFYLGMGADAPRAPSRWRRATPRIGRRARRWSCG